MKARPSIIWFVAVVATVIVLALWFGRGNAIETPLVVSAQTNISALFQPPLKPSFQSNALAAQTAPRNSIPPPSSELKEQQMRRELANNNDEEIFFHGLVVDQFNAPITDATVSGIIQVNNGTRVGTERISTMTDGSGLFTISGYKGKDLGIHVAKSGYVFAATNTSFTYSYLWPKSQRFTPDPYNPVIIKMWKLQGADPLVGIGNEYRLPFTGGPIIFDLIDRKVVSGGGDLEAVVTRASGSLSKKNPGDWSIELKPVRGGIIESDYQVAQFTFEAPADGYQISYFLKMNHDDPAWSDGFDKEFFLKSRDGQIYAKFYLVFGMNREQNDPLYFQFRGMANTNSSRNWEATAAQ